MEMRTAFVVMQQHEGALGEKAMWFLERGPEGEPRLTGNPHDGLAGFTSMQDAEEASKLALDDIRDNVRCRMTHYIIRVHFSEPA